MFDNNAVYPAEAVSRNIKKKKKELFGRHSQLQPEGGSSYQQKQTCSNFIYFFVEVRDTYVTL